MMMVCGKKITGVVQFNFTGNCLKNGKFVLFLFWNFSIM